MTEKNETIETADVVKVEVEADESTQVEQASQSGAYQADGAIVTGEQSEYEPTADELAAMQANKLEQAEKLASGAPVDVPGPELDGPASDASDLIDAAELSPASDDDGLDAAMADAADEMADHTAELTELSKFSDMAMAMELNRRRAAVALARQLEASERGPKADPERVRELAAALGDPKTIRYQPGHLVQWREGMKIASWPAYGEAVVVVRHLPAGEGLNDPDKQPMQCNSGEVFDLEVGCLVAGEDGETVLGTYMLPSRRMKPAQ